MSDGLSSSDPPSPRLPVATVSPRTSLGRGELLLLLLILVAAGVVRFPHLAHRSFWVDEYFTIQSVNGTGLRGVTDLPHGTLIDPVPAPTCPGPVSPWYHLLRADPQDIHPPIYYLMLRAWASVFGYGERGLRSFSAVVSIVGVFLLYATVRVLTGRAAPALWAALLMALAQPQIEFAREARSYALLQAIGLALCCLTVRIVRDGASNRRVIILAILALAGLLTHYFAASAIVAVGAFLLVRMRGIARWRLIIAGLAAGAAFVLIWGPAILMQRRGASGIGSRIFLDPGPGHLLRTLLRLIKLPGRYLNEPFPNAENASAVMFVICLLPCLMLRRRKDLLLWAIWVPVNIAPTLIVDLLNPTWSLQLIRYTLLASPGVYALIASLSMHRIAGHVLPFLAACGCIFSIESAYISHEPNWRGVGATLRAMQQPGDVIVFASMEDPRVATLIMFMGSEHYGRPFTGPVVLLDGPADATQLRLLHQFSRMLIISDLPEPDIFIPGAQQVESRSVPDSPAVTVMTLPATPSVAR